MCLFHSTHSGSDFDGNFSGADSSNGSPLSFQKRKGKGKNLSSFRITPEITAMKVYRFRTERWRGLPASIMQALARNEFYKWNLVAGLKLMRQLNQFSDEIELGVGMLIWVNQGKDRLSWNKQGLGGTIFLFLQDCDKINID